MNELADNLLGFVNHKDERTPSKYMILLIDTLSKKYFTIFIKRLEVCKEFCTKILKVNMNEDGFPNISLRDRLTVKDNHRKSQVREMAGRIRT